MFYQRVLSLIDEAGISKNKMLLDLGLNKSSMLNWEKRGNIPDGETLLKIARYFDVSVDYLLGNQDKSTGSLRVNIPDHVPLQLFAEETPKPEAYPQIISIMDEMSTEELADLKQYAEFIRSRKKD